MNLSVSTSNRPSKVLLAEDSPTQLEHTRMILENSGLEVIAANDGRDALAKARQFRPDIVMTDIVMPLMDGYDLCREIKADEELKRIPVILLTSLSAPDDVVKGLECGADQFLTKPVDEAFLINRLRAMEANRALRDQGASISEVAIDIAFGEKRYRINSNRMQILDLLLSTYANAVQKARELEKVNAKLRDALDTINTMRQLIPICCECRKIRDDAGYWDSMEDFLTKHSITEFSHGYCPDCAREIAQRAGLDTTSLDFASVLSRNTVKEAA